MFFRKNRNIKKYKPIIEAQLKEVDTFFRMINFFVYGRGLEYKKEFFIQITDYSSKSCQLYAALYKKSRIFSGLSYNLKVSDKELLLEDKTLIESYIYYQEKELEYLFKQCFLFIQQDMGIHLHYIHRLQYLSSYSITKKEFYKTLNKERIFIIEKEQLKKIDTIMRNVRKEEIRQIVLDRKSVV